jgi:hypothetical protein
MKESWTTNSCFFVFYVLMMAGAVWCCSGCTQQSTPTYVDAQTIVQHTPAAMAEQTYKINTEMERRTRK